FRPGSARLAPFRRSSDLETRASRRSGEMLLAHDHLALGAEFPRLEPVEIDARPHRAPVRVAAIPFRGPTPRGVTPFRQHPYPPPREIEHFEPHSLRLRPLEADHRPA